MENVICRLCMQLCTLEQSIPLLEIIEVVTYCVSIKVEEKDGLPSRVCGSCKTDALIAYNFKKRCLDSDRQFRYDSCNYPRNNTECQSTNKGLENTEQSETKTDELIEVKVFEEQLLQCRFCDMVFASKKRLDFHERRHEEGFKCHICDKEFATQRQLKNHINGHARRGAHLCQKCGKQFTLPENLVRHERIHSGVRPYKCKICEKAFTQSNDLKTHMYSHATEKNCLCSHCGKKFAREGSLKIHVRRMHLNTEWLHICTLCNKSFRDKRDLSQHKLIHSGERQHVCSVCNKAFNRISNLKVHERIHTGCKPYECSICHKRFIQKHVLTTHLKIHPPS